jgi:hypothetical protein
MRLNKNQNLERILESAVVVSWADLMRRALAHILEVLMQHQNAFALPPNLGRPGLLQITNAHGRGEHSSSRVGERSLRPRRLSTRRAHTGLNSSRILT